ncbi:MAG: SDR family NAD(P)-dependent oxidoreductase [Rikenellaceae bacterium]
MNKKIALVTGATSGIGEATALKLASQGYSIIITGRRSERLGVLKSAIEKIGVECTTLCFDVRSNEECEKYLLPLERVDLLVNNAGLASGMEHIDQGDLADWDAMIDTNVKGLLYVTRIIAPKMVAAESGHIINIGSIAGTEAYENGAVYCASKHAVHAISQSMRSDLLESSVKVSEIRPGMVETEFSTVRFHGDQQRADNVYKGVTPLTGEDIAEAIGWIAQLPSHMNVNDIVLMPTQQASAYKTYRKNNI